MLVYNPSKVPNYMLTLRLKLKQIVNFDILNFNLTDILQIVKSCFVNTV